MLKLPVKRVKSDFVIIDSQFPQKEPLGFRNTEINEYLKRFTNAEAYTMYPMMPGPKAWFAHGYGVAEEVFEENKKGYIRTHPHNSSKIHYLDPKKCYKFKLAYTFFLAETYVLLPFFEKNKVPFVFVLYPGGGFGLHNDKSDMMLRDIFKSRYFRGVIVTQKITQNYLVEEGLCSSDKVHFVYGGFVQFTKEEIIKKRFYPEDKSTLDICFVAAKYSEKGVDKGYDIFIEVAKRISAKCPNARFHVIGGFSEDEIDITDIRDKITFHGYKKPEFLINFYASMDIFLGPGRPFELFEGNFDGFPLGIDAAYCGVALFVSDPLKMNTLYREKKEVETIPLNTSAITDRIVKYYNDPKALYILSRQCQKRTQHLFNNEEQIQERVKVFEKYVKLEPHSKQHVETKK